MKQIKGLDTLRAFAVFFVVMQHLGVWFDAGTPIGHFILYVLIPDGGFGVTLFFVLSGFLITSILLNAKRSTENNNHFFTIKNFFIRRALRIFPIYYLLLLVLFLVNYQDVRQHIVYFATYTSNILIYHSGWNCLSHTWSLSIEEQFYLVWPWLVLFIKDEYLKYLFTGAIVTGIVSTHFALYSGHLHPMLVYHFFDAFGIGGFYAYTRHEFKESDKVKKIITALACICLVAYFYWKVMVYAEHPMHFIFMIKTVHSIIAVWLIMLVINNRSVWVKKYILENRFLNFIGKISYGIYLYHYVYNDALATPVNNFLNKVISHYSSNISPPDNHYYFWVHAAMIILISTIYYLFIERPILNLKKFFRYDRSRAK